MARILFLDSTAVVPSGPGSPAFFSRYAIAHLRSLGHDVTILHGFDPRAAQTADAVITEWANEEAFEAAASGLCKRLVVRLRGFDAHGPLDRLEWGNVDALVYESPFLKSYVEKRFPGLRGFRSHVIPSGVDVENILFRERSPGPVVAMVGRAVELKGYQLGMEWARQRPDIQLHVGMAFEETNPRLVEYLRRVKPANVTLHGAVDTVRWLDDIDANYLLSASIWETLGYTIAEAMALGIKPLIHDTPGAELNWPNAARWTSLYELNQHLAWGTVGAGATGYHSAVYRHFVEEHLDAGRQSAKFADLVLSLPTRTQKPKTETIDNLLYATTHALSSGAIQTADASVLRFREHAPASPHLTDSRIGLALGVAFRYYGADDLPRARTWALRAMADGASTAALCLLGEIAIGEDDLEGAERWYTGACALEPVPSRYPDGGLVEKREERLNEIRELLDPKLGKGTLPGRYLIVVAARNAEKYIGGCLESVKTQRHQLWKCAVIDDASTDGTAAIVDASVDALSMNMDKRFVIGHTGKRRWSLYNIVETIRVFGQPGDVVIILDGDDQLAPDALQHLDRAYYRKGAWLTYGNFITSSGKRSWMPPYPLKALREGLVRKFPWRVSHPKTFKFELFQHLTDADFTHDGKWFTTAGDVALMLPMLELAAERSVYIPEPLYVYNDVNDANDHKVDPDGQVRVRDLIYAKAPKKRLEKL